MLSKQTLQFRKAKRLSKTKETQQSHFRYAIETCFAQLVKQRMLPFHCEPEKHKKIAVRGQA